MTIKIIEITEISQRVMDAMAKLMPQLSASATVPTQEEMNSLIRSDCSILLAAVDENDPEGEIFGCMTLVVFRIPTGIRAWVEDVVVDDATRGRGIGEKLIVAALERAKAEGAKTVDLTSRPSREAANRLYVRCGFEARATNVYRYLIA